MNSTTWSISPMTASASMRTTRTPANSVATKHVVAHFVLDRLGQVVWTINFNSEMQSRTVEVHDISRDDVLPTKLQTVNLTVSQSAPQLRLGVRWVGSHQPRQSQFFSRCCPRQEGPIASSSSSHAPVIGQRPKRLRKFRLDSQSRPCPASTLPPSSGEGPGMGALTNPLLWSPCEHSGLKKRTGRQAQVMPRGFAARFCKQSLGACVKKLDCIRVGAGLRPARRACHGPEGRVIDPPLPQNGFANSP